MVALYSNTWSSALQSAALELERQRTTDSLRKQLEKRPERGELIERALCGCSTGRICYGLLIEMGNPGNILPDSTAAPALQGQQRELQRNMRANSLEQKIQHRPKPEDLIREGILEPDQETANV